MLLIGQEIFAEIYTTTETCLKLKLLILMRFENFLMIEYYTERMTKD